jgi:acyl carrier protein
LKSFYEANHSQDVALPEMTYSDWTTAVEPKVTGTWNLHHALPSDLDFFILFSSYSGIAGQWGQANYSAANTFLDAFVQYRHSQGLSASVIDIGAMGEVGFVSQNADIMTKFHKTGMRLLTENNLLDAMTLAILRSSPCFGAPSTSDGAYIQPSQILTGFETVVPISSPTNRVAWKRDVRMSIYHNINGVAESSSSGGTEENGLKALLSAADSRPEVLAENDGTTATEIIAKALASALGNILVKDEEAISLTLPLDALGVDSLVAMEVRNWIRKQISVDVSVFVIVQSTSLQALAENIRGAVLARVQSSSSSSL